MKIYQKIQKLNPHITIPLLLASFLFVITSCGTAAVVDTPDDVTPPITTPSTGVTFSDCPTSFTQEIVGIGNSTTVTWVEPTALDSNDNPVRIASQSNKPGDTFDLRDTTVTYTFTDAANNTETCTFTVTVNPDRNAPTFLTACPTGVTGVTNVTERFATVTWTPPTAQDSNNNELLPASVIANGNPVRSGDTFLLGTTTVTYTFMDAVGLQNSCFFMITVSQPASTDVTIVIACDNAIGITEVAGQSTTVRWTVPTAQDSNNNDIPPSGIMMTIPSTDADGNPLVDADGNPLASPLASDYLFPRGKTEVTYTFTDDAPTPNSATCSFTVEVFQPISTFVTLGTPCPEDIVTHIAATVTWTPPTAQDSNLNEIVPVASHDPDRTFPLHLTTVTYTFTDNGGNKGDPLCSFTVNSYSFDRADDTADPSATNPFLIQTKKNLSDLASLVNADSFYTLAGGSRPKYKAASYRLENSLNLGIGYTHTPIGDCKTARNTNTFPCGDSDDIAFTGTFDGNGESLSNLLSTRSHKSLGLFSVISNATISDLTLSRFTMSNTSANLYYTTGALVGTSIGSTISNVSVISGSIDGYYNIGGLVGRLSSGTITYSSSSGDVTGSVRDTSGGRDVGGLVGVSSGTIRASSSSAVVLGTRGVAGGLVGHLNGGTITASYASGAVTSGGFRGAGGLVGYQDGGTITASYARGRVTVSSRGAGGLVGSRAGGTAATTSYWNTSTSRLTTSAGGTGKTTTQLRVAGGARTIYSTWTTPPWVFRAGGYPTLSP